MTKQLLSFILFGFSFVSLFSQGVSEGEMFMRGDEPKPYKIQTEVTGTNVTTIHTENSFQTTQNYEVKYLFNTLSFEELKEKAKEDQKPYYVDFTAEWCQPCKLMEQTTFRDYSVVDFTHKNFYATQLDMSDFDAIEMQAMYDIKSLPTILFFSPQGQLIGRTTGLQTGTLFYKKLLEIHSQY